MREGVAQNLKSDYYSLLEMDRRQAAEYAFAIAMNCARQTDRISFEVWARMCLELLKQCDTETLEAAACLHAEIGGVLIPELFHEGTVRQRFAAAAAELGRQHFGHYPTAAPPPVEQSTPALA